MTRQIFAAEITLQETPHAVRDNFNGSEKNIRRLLALLKPAVEEVFILATAQRFSVYVVDKDISLLTSFFHHEHSLKGHTTFYYNTGESVTHLMATASGLLSPIKGDLLVLDEIQRCYQWASDANCLGVILDNTLARAVETGKAVRTGSGIDKFCASAIEIGLDMLYNHMENVHRKNFLVIGTGHMATLALDYLTREGVRHVAVAGSDPVLTAALAKRYHAKAINAGSIVQCFLEADVIIGASSGPLDLVFPPEAKKHLEKDQNRFVLDLGMPPNFSDPWVEGCAEGFYNLDDLRRIQPSPVESFGGLEEAWRMVVRASNEFVHLLQLLHHSPVLTAYLNRQFGLKSNTEWKPGRWRMLKTMLFKKQDSATGISQAGGYNHEKLHLNNCVPENAYEVVRNIATSPKFRFYLSDN